MPYKIDMEKEVLEVKVDETIGDGSTVELSFYGDGGSTWIGDVVLNLLTWRYQTNACGSQGALLGDKHDLQTQEIWTFSINRDDQGHHKITALREDQLVLDIIMSEENCESWGWSDNWDKDITNVGFPVTDTGSEQYRHYPPPPDTPGDDN